MSLPLSVCCVGTGGSSGQTLACVEDSIATLEEGARFTFIDTQPFNLRTGGETAYRGRAKKIVARPQAVGLRTPTRSWTANLLLSGARFAYRRMVDHAASVLRSIEADVLVLCHDRIYIETAFVEAARAMGIPTVMLQEGPFCAVGHGRANDWRLRLKQLAAPAINILGIVPPIPDYGFAGHRLVLAASEAYRNKWVAAGLPESQIRVTGIPRYDPLARYKTQVIGTRNSVPRLLYLVQPFAAHGKVNAAAADVLLVELANALNSLAESQPFEFMVRPHPRSSGDDVRALRQHLKAPLIMDDSSRPVEQSLLGSDLILGHYSSGLLESLMMGRRIVCMPVPMNAFAEPDEAKKQEWLTQVAPAIGSNSSAIRNAIINMLSTEAGVQRMTALEEEVGVVDGLAATRCAVAIHGLAEQHFRSSH